MFKSKRGISPLVATLLLIGFAVALGGVVMSWGQNIVEEGAAGHASCVDVNVKVQSLPGIGKKVCYGGVGPGGFIDFVLENDAPFAVDGVNVWIFGQAFDHSNIVKVTDVSGLDIKAGEPYVGHILYDFTRFGTITSVHLVPKVLQKDSYVLCHDQAVVIEDISVC
ncbi:MAG: archaellin/type IV pilin N-terminal domain-containing protein [Nanoarchaeota archaeon]|nr:archaellin/type IV pilin N-terminal domain-containing protein [Nanoarchaeota archaeon]